MGYEITNYFRQGSGYRPFDQVIYYPDPAGGRGYVYYVGIVNGSSEYDGDWFHANQEAETVLKGWIEAKKEAFALAAKLARFSLKVRPN